MKRNNTTCKGLIAVILTVILATTLTACGNSDAELPSWETAIYTEDVTLGKGEKSFDLEVVFEDNSITLTVNTDEEILGDALLEYNLISGDEGPYGLYVKEVNGIYADYDVNGYYWSFTKNGETSMTGVDGEKVEQGANYEMTCTR